MKKTTNLLFILAGVIVCIGCNKVVNREIGCRGFALTDQYYWCPESFGDTITFVNQHNDSAKYVVVDKTITHRIKYISDTGCGCSDLTGMLLIHEDDSIWFRHSLLYIENQTGNQYEDIVFVLDHVQSAFIETNRSALASYETNELTFSNVRQYEKTYAEPTKVNKVFTVKNLGIIRFELVNGDVWTNANLTNYVVTTQGSFSYSENICQ